jgi:hypothetical protein
MYVCITIALMSRLLLSKKVSLTAKALPSSIAGSCELVLASEWISLLLVNVAAHMYTRTCTTQQSIHVHNIKAGKRAQPPLH